MYPTLFLTPGLAKFAEEIDAERTRQLAKFGDQRHPDGTGPHTTSWAPLLRADEAATATRNRCQRAAERGDLTWRHVLSEEVAEAFAESDPAKLRAELLQVAAVCAAWVSDLDRRPAEQCDVEFVGGGRCAKLAGHRPPGSQDPHVPQAVAEPVLAEPDCQCLPASPAAPRIYCDACHAAEPAKES